MFCLKVTIKEVSTNWNVSLKDSETAMAKWALNYKGDRQLQKEYLIRGKDLNGNCVISVGHIDIYILSVKQNEFRHYMSHLFHLLGCIREKIRGAGKTMPKLL